MEPFISDIIENPNYLKYRGLRGTLFILFFIIAVPAQFMGGSSKGSVSDDFGLFNLLIYGIVLALLYASYRMLSSYSLKYEKIGKLTLTDQYVQVEKGDITKQFLFSEIKKIIIDRGSTYHKDDTEENYVGNNFVEILINEDDKERIEFAIHSEEHNKEFEKMIYTLRMKLKYKILYRSI